MTNIKEIGALNHNQIIWKYVPLEVLIDILENNRLYITPLKDYVNSDPFEGYLPYTAMEAHKEIFDDQFADLKQSIEKLKISNKDKTLSSVDVQKIEELENKIQNQLSFNVYNLIRNDIRVSCWHINRSESDAMWRLYSSSNKGIAIKTTIGRLLESFVDKYSKNPIQVGKIKYIDFFDKSLDPKDCLVDGGYLTPLLKRIEFKHENELRVFVIPRSDIDSYVLPSYLKIDKEKLISKLYISPYANEPFISSVGAICNKYRIQKRKISNSGLLKEFKVYEKDFKLNN